MRALALMALLATATLTGCDGDMTQENSAVVVKKKKVSFEELPGFDQADLKSAATSFQKSCEKLLSLEASSLVQERSVKGHSWRSVCKKYLKTPSETSRAFKEFLQVHFTPYKMSTSEKEDGLLTGYFRPELKVSPKKSKAFPYPIYRKPLELHVLEDLAPFNKKASGIRISYRLEGAEIKPFYTRQEIETNSLANKDLEIAWAQDPYDLFFMHIQGSGRLVFEEGHHLDVGYGGTNGYEYTSVGKILLENGTISAADMSMGSIKKWMRANPEKAIGLMRENRSYVFFSELTSKAQMPVGSQNVELTTLASIATDPRYIPLGAPVWLDASETIQSLVIAQDVGGAIKGPLRADLFCGSGPKAGDLAGPLKDRCGFYILQPNSQ